MNRAMSRSSTPGRPAGGDGEKVRTDLLNAARDHFLKRDFKAVSLREIAASAGVNGAMVNYYFGGKRGLYLAMVETMFEALEARMQELNENEEYTVANFSRGYAILLAENPWWPNFFVREILFSEGETREAVLQRINTMIAPKLLHSIQQEIEAGRFRRELKPELTILSLMAMTIFPFLAAPLLERIFDFELSPDSVEALTAHNIALFMHGVVPRESAQNEGATA